MAGRVSSAALCCCRRTASTARQSSSTQARRRFTTSRSKQKNGALPSLTTSDAAAPELKALLQEIRTAIFVPSHLSRPQLNLIYKQKNQSILINDPVEVTIGAEDLTLQHLDRLNDEPNTWKSLNKAMRLLGSSAEDWRSVFPGLLEGFKTAGRKFKQGQWQSLLRKAGQQKMVGAVVESARRAERTGLKLSDVRLAREVFWGCREFALGGEQSWDEAPTLQALRFAEQTAELLELEKHCGDAKFSVGERDPRTQPDCMGVLLELAAVRAQKHLDGNDDDGKVRAYAERLIINLEKGLGEGMDKVEEEHVAAGRTSMAADYELRRWVPVMHGLELASEVLGPDVPRKEVLDAKLKELKAKVEEHQKQIADGDTQGRSVARQGLQWLQELESS